MLFTVLLIFDTVRDRRRKGLDGSRQLPLVTASARESKACCRSDSVSYSQAELAGKLCSNDVSFQIEPMNTVCGEHKNSNGARLLKTTNLMLPVRTAFFPALTKVKDFDSL